MEGRNILTFRDLGLCSEILQSLKHMGFEKATPIQVQTIPLAMQGYDLLGQAQTGTGKTAAFGIPIIEQATLDVDLLQSLVITPTRELAIQVAKELNRLGQYRNVRTLPIYGGQDINRQIRALKKKPQIIVGTPGRLQDHIRRRTIRLHALKQVVLDEADEMLQMGFREEIEAILSHIPTERQILLFSATMPDSIKTLAKRFMHKPKEIKIKAQSLTMPNIQQSYLEITSKQKFDVLCHLLDIQSSDRSIVFGRTKKRVAEITEGLFKRGYRTEAIHGDLSQAQRNAVIRNFRKGSTNIMVATDVAARGLDIPDVTHIYNFDIPQFAESYIHRIGRTGRAGKTGVAITFVTSREMGHLRQIERITKQKMKRKPIPIPSQVMAGPQSSTLEQLFSVMQQKTYRNYIGLAEKLIAQNDSVTLLSAALKLIANESNQTPVKLTEETPFMGKKSVKKGKQKQKHFQRKTHPTKKASHKPTKLKKAKKRVQKVSL